MWGLRSVRQAVSLSGFSETRPGSVSPLQARILERVATPSSRGSSRPGDGTRVVSLHLQAGS